MDVASQHQQQRIAGDTSPPRGRPVSPLLSGFHSREQLPHLKREGGTYFVSFRLSGTLPGEVLAQFKRERDQIVANAHQGKRPLTWHEQEALFRWHSERVDRYLDSGHGECWLKELKIAELVAKALQFHAGVRFELSAWVIMPNHVHVVVCPRPGWSLSRILNSWKGFTAHEANRALGRTGSHFWQRESYDHLIRDEDDRYRCCHYTVANPVDAGLCDRPEQWRWSSAYRAGA
jgi:REP element-mobilizing transposase RayT